jgi:basic amino acid/polyamine antiporter, APA family
MNKQSLMSFFSDIRRRKTIASALASVQSDADSAHGGLQKNLGVVDLTAMGIAAIIGAGIFSTIGVASANGGPAVTLLFVFTAFACGFSALCYAQFASTLPISGSAYTYTYTTFGELLAWIVGWNLLWEYAIGNIAVAISWSDYFTGLLDGLGLYMPRWMTLDYFSASKATALIQGLQAAGKDVSPSLITAAEAWNTAPMIGGLRIIADFPTLIISLLVTWLVYRGIKESRNASNGLVIFKLLVILMVIVVGIFYVQPANWSPFAPNGVKGVLAGISAVFFAYIGFDAISTTAEECKNPQRDLPRSMFYSLVICTILYVLIALILTGMVKYDTLNGQGDPLAFVFRQNNLNFISGIIAVSAVVATASVFLVFQLGQPRIWMAMSRDGLLPARFAKIHPKFKTPSFSTILTGAIVAIPALFLNLNEVADLTSLGTLFAFAIVCAGIIIMDETGTTAQAKFKVTYINGRYWLPVVFAALGGILYYTYPNILTAMTTPPEDGSQWDLLPFYLFLTITAIVSVLTLIRQWSLIPVVGLLLNSFMMSQTMLVSWQRFLVWMLIGMAVYMGYGFWNSKLRAN